MSFSGVLLDSRPISATVSGSCEQRTSRFPFNAIPLVFDLNCFIAKQMRRQCKQAVVFHRSERSVLRFRFVSFDGWYNWKMTRPFLRPIPIPMTFVRSHGGCRYYILTMWTYTGTYTTVKLIFRFLICVSHSERRVGNHPVVRVGIGQPERRRAVRHQHACQHTHRALQHV